MKSISEIYKNDNTRNTEGGDNEDGYVKPNMRVLFYDAESREINQ